jgi:peroxin-3
MVGIIAKIGNKNIINECRLRRRTLAVVAAGVAGGTAAYLTYSWWMSEKQSEDGNSTEDEGNSIRDNKIIHVEKKETDKEFGEGSKAQRDGGMREDESGLLPGGLPLDDLATHDAMAQEDSNLHLERHFKSIQDIAQSTTLPSLLVPLADSMKGLDGMEIKLQKLADAKSGKVPLDVQEKKKIWQDIGKDAVGRAVASIWLLPLLHLQIRVQLTVLGRNLYLGSVMAESEDLSEGYGKKGSGSINVPHLSAESQEAFLSLAEYLGNEGFEQIMEGARLAADSVVSGLELTDTMHGAESNSLLSRALELFDQWVREKKFVQLILPPPNTLRQALALDHPNDNAVFHGAESSWIDADCVEAMFHETEKIISSKFFASVVYETASNIARMMSESVVSHIPSNGCAFVTLIPVIAREAARVLEPEGKYCSSLASMPGTISLTRVIYSCGSNLDDLD